MRGSVRSAVASSAFRYLIIGGLSFVLDFGLLFVLHELLTVPLWISASSAFLASFAFNYLLQRAFSFSSHAHHGRALAKYALLVVFNTGATTVIVAGFDYFGSPWEVGKVVSTVVTTLWNYFIYRYWIFRAAEVESPDGPSHGPDERLGMTRPAESEGN